SLSTKLQEPRLLHFSLLDKAMAVEVDVQGKTRSYSAEDSHLVIIVGKRLQRIPLYDVVSADFNREVKSLELGYVTRRKKSGPLLFIRVKGQVKGSEDEAAEFSTTLLEKAYEGVKRNRRLKVLINPNGGVGKAVPLFKLSVEPVLRAAGCSLDIVHTKGHGDAFDIAKNLPLDEFDALLTVSGDGLIHEVLNGFGKHPKPKKALAIPVAPVPAGSGNGLSLNLLGIEDGFDPVAAALNAVKGKPMSIDIFSITQNGETSLSFMSQALGLMADLDLGTEHLRWMGDTRFFYGFLRGLIKFKSCALELSYKIAEEDKNTMFNTLKARREGTRPNYTPPAEDLGDVALPKPRYSSTDNDGWTTFDKPSLFIYAGQGPYVGRDFMAFPVSLPDDGLIDIFVQAKSTRGDAIAMMDEAPRGGIYWNENCHYIKAHAYRIRPLSKRGSLSVDGERYPFEEFQVEVIPKLATLLSPYGCYAAEFKRQES
ncbi:sphingosine kinase, partial [Moniliophthora roreri MCA 2997]